MAKNALAEVDPRTRALDVPPEFLEELGKHEGQGVSDRPEDNLIPLIYLLQDGSPQVKKREPKYIEGAEAGDIILTNLKRLYKGSTGIVFQPVAFTVDWGEWIKRDKGGGFVARHTSRPPNALEVPDPKAQGRRMLWEMPNGNDLIETRNHYGYILDPELGPMQALLPLTSTGHQVSRAWMTEMRTKRLPDGRRAPSYARAYRLTSVVRKNVGNPDSFTYQVQDEGWLPMEQIRLGIDLARDISDGVRVAAEPEAGSTASEMDDSIPF
jgi:hypothetical protein